MSSAFSTLPGQQPPGYQIQQPYPQALPATTNTRHYSSGSVGPFFTVLSVLTVLAFLSCYVGRICSKKEAVMNSLDTIGEEGCAGCIGNKWSTKSVGGDVEVGASKVMSHADEKRDAPGNPS